MGTIRDELKLEGIAPYTRTYSNPNLSLGQILFYTPAHKALQPCQVRITHIGLRYIATVRTGPNAKGILYFDSNTLQEVKVPPPFGQAWLREEDYRKLQTALQTWIEFKRQVRAWKLPPVTIDVVLSCQQLLHLDQPKPKPCSPLEKLRWRRTKPTPNQ